MPIIGRILGLLLWPAVVLGVALWLDSAPLWPAGARALLLPASYLICGLGAMVAWRFSQSNAVLSFALLALAIYALAHPPLRFAGTPIDKTAFRAVVFSVVALNLAWLGSVAERGIVSPAGRTRLAVLATEAVVVLMAFWLAPVGVARIATTPFLPAKPALVAALPDALVVALAFACGRLIVTVVERANASSAAQLGASIALGLAYRANTDGTVALAILAAAALLLAAATIQDSYVAAFMDPLTHLPGRRALDAQLRRLGDRYAVAMVDVDRFKTFNDTYGHDVGDQVLRLVGARLSEIGGGGKPFRFGGEEFTVVFPGKTVDEAMPALEELRLAVERSTFRLRARDRFRLHRGRRKAIAKGPAEVSVTISIGVAERAEGDRKPDDAIHRADTALYRAKDAGRNRIAR